MKLWVGVTDRNWYEFLSARNPDEVNFWQPRRSDARLRSKPARRYRKASIVGDPEIGCNVLDRPFFWDEADWNPFPRAGRRTSFRDAAATCHSPKVKGCGRPSPTA